MALIKCPECGKEISDKATTCINCGFPLSELNNMTIVEETPNIEDTPNKEVVYYDMLEAERKIVFDNGFDEGASGKCITNGSSDDYVVENGFVNISRCLGVVKYKIDGDFLVCLNGGEFEDITIPKQDTFNATFTNNNSAGVKTISYKDDGTYDGNSYGRKDYGTYKRKGQIIVKCGTSTGNIPNGFLIYEDNIYTTSYIKAEKVDELKEIISQFGVSQRVTYTTPVYTPTKPTVKCPYCQSENTKKISSTAKAVNIAMFGLFGNKRKYQWHCNNCNSDF